MPDISVSDDNFERLQRMVRSFETVDDVVGWLLDRHEKKRLVHCISDIPDSVVGKGLFFVPETIPPLTHTELRFVAFEGNELMRPTWQRLASEMLDIAYQRLGGFDALRRVTNAVIVQGTEPREGFNALERAPVSFRVVSADRAFQITASLARRVNVPFVIHFEWPMDDAAEHPGEMGACAWWPYEA